MKRIPFASLVLCLAFLSAATCRAQFGFTGAQSTLIEPSVRFSGMGRTGTAVFWGSNPNDWANPALLPYNDGLRFESSRTPLVPDLWDGVFVTTNRLVWGRWGLGLSMAGRPIDISGGVRLDYGQSEAVDVDGNVIGRFHAFEDDNTVAVGASLLQLVGSASRLVGHGLPAIDRFGDISAGHTWKKIQAEETGDLHVFGSAEVSEKDRGYLARLTPYDAARYPGLIPGLESVARLTVEGSYGASELNSDAKDAVYKDRLLSPSPVPVIEDHRRAIAFHAAAALPGSVEGRLRQSGKGWVYDLMTPLLSYTRTSEHTIFYLRGVTAGDEERRSGWEMTFANVFSYRKGHQDDPIGEIIGDTSGWGVGLHFRGVAGIQYDHATVPQSIYLGKVKRNGVYVYVDPVWAVRRIP